MDLPADIARELAQVSHRGKAPAVRALVEDAIEAIDEERYEDAIVALTAAKRDAPRAGTVRELLGLAHYHAEAWREAARELATYRRLTGRADQDHVYADCERALGRPDKAVELLASPIPADMDEETAVERRIVLAGAFLDLDRAGDAVAVLSAGPIEPRSVEPYHLRLWYTLADALERADRRRDARGWWDAVYAEDPEFFDVAQRRLGLRSSARGRP